MHQLETQGDHVEAVTEEEIKETITIKNFDGQGTELLNSPLTKREEMSAILCLGMNQNLLREEAGNGPECSVRSSLM